MASEELKLEVKKHIINYCNLIDVEPEGVGDDTSLFGDGLGLDSIDSLELVVLLEREYGIKINNPQEGRKILIDVNHMADYIEANKTKG